MLAVLLPAKAGLPTWTDRYLALLGLEREAPSLDALTRLVRAHVLNVPFENVTALLRRRDCPTGPVPLRGDAAVGAGTLPWLIRPS